MNAKEIIEEIIESSYVSFDINIIEDKNRKDYLLFDDGYLYLTEDEMEELSDFIYKYKLTSSNAKYTIFAIALFKYKDKIYTIEEELIDDYHWFSVYEATVSEW